MAFTASDILKIILAIILPPLGVFFERGCGADLLINILLTILGYMCVPCSRVVSQVVWAQLTSCLYSTLHHSQVLSMLLCCALSVMDFNLSVMPNVTDTPLCTFCSQVI
ncbi:Pmp3 domain-containing protein [Rhizoctonia solani AG-1 IA]|uniref:Pmp3 domain-containing protein n=1 Tax=Thanatephorus cucumeris (strain AG1-IA) TaxID=983506 RepID=L8X5H0_THACA|nr:Pmp3 domain-containing protein [Rhizoctonia solani AG-1 IA]